MDDTISPFDRPLTHKSIFNIVYFTLNIFRSKEFSQPFLQPLLSSLSSEERAEWEVLLQGSIPMDLSCIEGNIRAMKYRSIKDFVNDVQQIER